MKQQVSVPLIIGIVVVVVALLGFIGWQVLGSHQPSTSADVLKAAKARKAKHEPD